MEIDRKIDKEVPNLLVRYRGEVEESVREGVREALLRHKREGNSVAVWRDGRVVILSPDEIPVTSE
jgi:hypothetical protein